jgi:hypothetical protein
MRTARIAIIARASNMANPPQIDLAQGIGHEKSDEHFENPFSI